MKCSLCILNINIFNMVMVIMIVIHQSSSTMVEDEIVQIDVNQGGEEEVDAFFIWNDENSADKKLTIASLLSTSALLSSLTYEVVLGYSDT